MLPEESFVIHQRGEALLRLGVGVLEENLNKSDSKYFFVSSIFLMVQSSQSDLHLRAPR